MNAPAIKMSRGRLILAALFVYLLLVSLIFFKILRNNNGHFVYTQDDPYIHLALSEQLAHGHYGLNPGETASPSSSILWPFLLIPFAGHAAQAYMPLFWNLLFGALAACVIAATVERLPGFDEEHTGSLRARQLTILVLLTLDANLIALTFVGMEHTLQVLLAILCAAGLIRTWQQAKVPAWCLVAAAIGPMVRYESISITVAVCLVLIGLRQWRRSVALFAIAVTPMALFGLYLRHLGLPMLPLSVLVKGHANRGSGAMHPLVQTLSDNLRIIPDRPSSWPILLLTVVLIIACLRERDRLRRFILAAAALVALLQILVGRFDASNRYEPYAVIFATLIFVCAAKAPRSISFAYVALALFFIGSNFTEGARRAAALSRSIYDQQYQMHRFIAQFHPSGVAVNDLGLTSFERPQGVYILDLVGLASPEASREVHKTPAWLKNITEEHGIDLAILYPEWFHIPPSWTPVAKICTPENMKELGGQCVVFYSTEDRATQTIREEFARFAPTLPSEDIVQTDPPRQEGGLLMPQRQ